MEYPYAVNDQIHVTDQAKEKFVELLKGNEQACAVRLFVLGGGCSGMSYSMAFANEKFDTDSAYELDGVKIYIDPVALNYLAGVEIDYSESEMGASFLFNNVFQIIGGSGSCSGCASAQS